MRQEQRTRLTREQLDPICQAELLTDGVARRERAVAEQKLFFEDVHEGDEAPVVRHELSRTDLVRYAGASGDLNPMHHDEVKAREAGLPSVFGHGMFSMGVVGRAVTDYVGVGNLRNFRVRFTEQTWPGDVLATRVVVTGKREQDGAHEIELDVELNSDAGATVVKGTAIASLPSRG